MEKAKYIVLHFGWTDLLINLEQLNGRDLDIEITGNFTSMVHSQSLLHQAINLSQSSVTSDTLLWNTSPQVVMCPFVSPASSSGTRLHRGYVEEAAPEDTPPETTHIVFVVHGIGQKMDQGRIIRNTSMWVNCSCSVGTVGAAVGRRIEWNQNHSRE